MGPTWPYWGLKVDFWICALTYIVKYVLLGQKAGWTPCRMYQICHVHSIYQSVNERVVRQQRLSRARVRGQCRHISRPHTAGYRVWARGRIGREPEATRPALHTPSLELSTGLREISQCLEKALTRVSSLCKVPTSALTMDVSEPKNLFWTAN